MSYGTDPRFHIAKALEALKKAKMHNESDEFMNRLNNVGGPDEAIDLSYEYMRKASTKNEEFSKGHDGARGE